MVSDSIYYLGKYVKGWPKLGLSTDVLARIGRFSTKRLDRDNGYRLQPSRTGYLGNAANKAYEMAIMLEDAAKKLRKFAGETLAGQCWVDDNAYPPETFPDL